MSRYIAQLTSAAALSSGTAFGWVGYSSTVGLKLRRVQLGTIAGTSAPSSQQLQVGINITSSGSATGGTAVTTTKMNPSYPTAGNALYTGWGTAPTLAGTDAVSLAFNSQSGGDWPWEVPEDFWPAAVPASTVGFAFVNRVNALPAGMSLILTTEWEELQAGRPGHKRWRAQVTDKGKWVNLGLYDTAEEAAAARRTWDEAHG